VAPVLITRRIAIQMFWFIAWRGILGKVADDEIKLVQVATAQGLITVTGDDSLVAQTAEGVFEYCTQLIVIIDDENSTFLHPAPIFQ
jgi:hypothetical protein